MDISFGKNYLNGPKLDEFYLVFMIELVYRF
jgi:hypothetical protein